MCDIILIHRRAKFSAASLATPYVSTRLAHLCLAARHFDLEFTEASRPARNAHRGEVRDCKYPPPTLTLERHIKSEKFQGIAAGVMIVTLLLTVAVVLVIVGVRH